MTQVYPTRSLLSPLYSMKAVSMIIEELLRTFSRCLSWTQYAVMQVPILWWLQGASGIRAWVSLNLDMMTVSNRSQSSTSAMCRSINLTNERPPTVLPPACSLTPTSYPSTHPETSKCHHPLTSRTSSSRRFPASPVSFHKRYSRSRRNLWTWIFGIRP